MDDSFYERQEAMMSAISDVFTQYDADAFEMYRVLYIMKKSLVTMMVDQLQGYQGLLESLLDMLEGDMESE